MADWVQIDFAGTQTIDEIDAFTLQDNYYNPVDPTASMTFTRYGVTTYDVQYWDGGSWVTVPGGSVTGNNNVWRTFSFPAVTTDRIRVVVNGALGGYSRIVEIEAYSGGSVNIAPTVSLTAPADNAMYTAPAMIALTADATDSDGIARVEFYQGSTLLGASTASPYAYTWNNVPAGNYVLTAKAYDSLGASTVSSPVNVTVNPSGGAAVNVAAQANGGIASVLVELQRGLSGGGGERRRSQGCELG